ncbi:MAG: hypothetical protein J5691_06255 [Bacilli bacterium]|nr:hypothetical protein [Bacilli bacterium]
MKKYGKIIIAFMWLGLTMIMIVGATFAWFAENRNVEAGGMEIKAETVKNLMISNAAEGTYGISADSALTGVKELAPASTATALADSAFFAAVDATRTNGYIDAATGQITGTPATPTPFRAANINTVAQGSENHVEVVKHTFYIKSDGTALGSLYVKSISVMHKDASNNDALINPASDISKAIRVAVVYDTTAKIFAPVYSQLSETAPSYNGITAVTPTTAAVTLSTPDGDATTPSCVLTTSIPATTGTPLTVYVYIWYEGQDLNCTSAKSANVEDLVVTVTFGATEASN